MFLSTIPEWRTQALVYAGMGGFVGMFYFANYLNKKVPGEFMSSGDLEDFWKYTKYGTIAVAIWLALYLMLLKGFFQPQSVVPFSGLLSTGVLLIAIPVIETAFFVGFVLATSATLIGIIPAVILASALTGGFHWWVFQATPVHMYMSMLYGLIVYPVALAFKSKYPAVHAHILANLASLLS